MKIRTLFLSIACACSFSGAPLHAEGESHWIAPHEGAQKIGSTPCPIFRSTFALEAEPVSGSVRVIGLGHYELLLNGKRPGQALINEAWSEYNKTIYFQEFDITKLLKKGENVWGVMLGNSFWRVEKPTDTMRYVKTDAMPYFSEGRPFLLWLEARIRTADGRQSVISSDGSWRWHDGPLTSSNIYGGEDYDARLNPAGWTGTGYDDRSWEHAKVVPPPRGSIEKFTAPPITAPEVFKPVKIVSPGPGEYTYIFEQNCSSLLRFTVRGAPGERIRFKPSEYVDSTGHVKFTYTWGTGKEIWHDYTIGNTAEEMHQTLFCYVGAQYIGVTGAVPEGYPNPKKLPVIKSLEIVHTRAPFFQSMLYTTCSRNHFTDRVNACASTSRVTALSRPA